MLLRVTSAFLFLSAALCLGAEVMMLKQDERIVFRPGIARHDAGDATWRITVGGVIFEPERRGIPLAVVREALDMRGVELTATEAKIFNDRARLFLVDHERRKNIVIRFGARTFSIGKSKRDGEFSGEIKLDDEIVRQSLSTRLGAGQWLGFEAALPAGDGRVFRGGAIVVEENGLSVISDIDDTIKITEVRDRHRMLRNTFASEFRAVPGMAGFYRLLAKERGATFHYVSASPWQLFEPLETFVEKQGFPSGTFALKEFEWKNRTALSLFADPEKYKPTVIEPLLRQLPDRRFILIGDSGERDPEIYAALARKFPKKIEHIYVRDVTDESPESPRYQQAFRGLPNGLWTIFTRPEQLQLPAVTPAR